MKLSHGLGLALAGICSAGFLGAASLAGCSSSSGGSSGNGGGSGGGDLCSSLPATACSSPPAVPTGASMTTQTTPHNYALHHLFLGDVDRSNNMTPDAWKSFGYNLDGKITTEGSTDVCTLQAGASKSVQADGPGGIDNSFGENLIPTLQAFASTPSATINTSIEAGHFTVMLDVNGFDNTAGSMTSATGLTGVLLAGGAIADGGTPTWDMNTHWPILPDLIMGCTATGGCPMGTDPVKNADVQFTKAFQSKGQFVSAAVGGSSTSDIQLSLTISSQTITINVHSALVTFEPGGSGKVTNGIIAGVLNTGELVQQIGEIAGSISSSLCMGSAITTIESEIAQYSDILVSGSTVTNTSGAQCNGISIGLGFDADEIAQPTSADILPGTPPKPSACSDAGMGGD